MSARKVLVLQQVEHEGLGTIGDLLEDRGVDIEFVRFYSDYNIPRDISDYSALIVLGGPMGVSETEIHPFIAEELLLISDALMADIPMLGICLGAQLIAAAAGASVYSGPEKEIGWYDLKLAPAATEDPLFSRLPESLSVFQWHGDTFNIPHCATLLASSDLFAHQAFRVGKSAYGLQFHLEVTEAMIGEWIEENSDELGTLVGVIDPTAIISETPVNIGVLNDFGATLFKEFLDLADL